MKVPLSHLISQQTEGPVAEASVNSANDGDAFTEAMQAFYAEVEATVASHSPVCINRGHCCKFDSFGHKLYVTEIEMRYFSEGMRASWIEPAGEATCPYQSGGRCNARERRPLGCRIFFCDPGAQAWQGPAYEQFLGRLKAIGEAFSVPYRYREWLSALSGVAAQYD